MTLQLHCHYLQAIAPVKITSKALLFGPPRTLGNANSATYIGKRVHSFICPAATRPANFVQVPVV